MKLETAAFLADANVHPALVAHLRAAGHDVRDVMSGTLVSATDAELIRLATSELRIVITHDSDFGRLAIADGEPYVGLIFLRPGHIAPEFSIDSLKTVLTAHPVVRPPFIIVARRRADRVDIRVREQPA